MSSTISHSTNCGLAKQMAVVLWPIILLVAFETVCVRPKEIIRKVPPTFGDVRVDENDVVLLYLGTDGSNFTHLWGTINTDGTSSKDDIAKTVCHMLGYSKVAKIFSGSPGKEYNNLPVWLTNVHCPPQGDTHILRCSYVLAQYYDYDHARDLRVQCDSSSWIIRTSNSDTTYTYEGEVAIFPPDDIWRDATSKIKFTPSYGVVAIRQSNTWRYPASNQEYQLTIEAADTIICRSLGFTHSVPNSAVTVHKMEEIFSYQFGNASDRLTTAFNVSDIQCNHVCPCMGCCIQNPKQLNDNPFENAITIRCTYYNSTKSADLPTGSEEICSEASRSSRVCSDGNTQTSSGPSNTVIILSTILAVIILILVIAVVVYCLKCLKREKYEVIPNGEGRNGNGNAAQEDNA